MRALIIGCGYAGMPLGKLLADAGHEVHGLRRSPDAQTVLGANGIRPIEADITDLAQLLEIDPFYDLVVNLVSSSRGGPEEYRRVYLEGTRNIIRWLTFNPPKRYLYTSSTSVYAQEDGSWVDEQSAATPASATSRILLETEAEVLRAHEDSGFPSIVLRASGIYGPGRGHLFKQFTRGEATMRDHGANYLNMIHVRDLARAIVHLSAHGAAGEIYNATDDEPVTQLEFFTWLAELLHRALPPSAPPDADRKRGLTNKRVSNRKLKSTGFTFTFPNFRAGYLPEIELLGKA